VVTGGEVTATFLRLVAIDPGFQADRVLASVVLPAPARYPDPAKRAVFYRHMLDAVRAIPGVQSAGTVDALPFSGENHGGFVHAGGAQLVAEINVAGGDYLQAMGIRLEQGRWFHEEEDGSAMVSRMIANKLWPGADAIGQRICVFCTPESPSNWKTVIGVVADASHVALDQPATGSIYLAADA